MSTIASPRPSIALSSRRTSVSTDATARSVSASRLPAQGSARRNRVALRDYYGLKESQNESDSTLPPPEVEKESELDRDGFDAEQYVKDMLTKESLESILRTEASLVSETRSLDGEKKALVYDNYSKLIAATETIRKMRTNMDPLSPTTSSLTPAITHIAETSITLSETLRKQHGNAVAEERKQSLEAAKRRTVLWVLDAPARLETLVAAGQTDEAGQQFEAVKNLLDKWKGVAGTERVRQECIEALGPNAT